MVVVSVLFLQLFANRPRPKFSSYPKSDGRKSLWLNANLYPLYLEGPDKATFLKILQDMKADKQQKIVFQFFYQKNGILKLATYTGRIDGHKYKEDMDFKLQSYNNCVIINMDDLKGGLYLGAMEFDQNSDLDKLIGVVASKNIIVFMPALYPIANKNAIMYKICTADTEADICSSDQKKTNTGINTNPSPPHGGN